MDNYIKAVEEIGFVKTDEATYGNMESVRFKYKKAIILTVQYWGDHANIFTSKRRAGVLTTEKEFSVYGITEPQLPLAIRAIVRFWAKNGVKLGKEKK